MKIITLYFTLFIFILPSISQIQNDLKSTPVTEWKYKSSAPFFSSPVIYENVVYAGSLDSHFYAIDLFNGKKIWDYKTGGEIRSTALVNDNNIYFICGDGNLYCLNKSGKLIWICRTEGEKKYDFADYHQSSPIEFNNTIFFGSGDGNVYAVNPVNGDLKWKYKTGNVVHSTPAVDSSGLYNGSFDGYIYSLNIIDGSLKWKFKTTGHKYFPQGEVQGSPSINTNYVTIGARDYNVYTLDKETGILVWNKIFTNGWVLSNTFKDNELFIAGADERILACLNPATGEEKWSRKMEFLMFGRPAFSKTLLYIGTTIGKLHGVDLKTGEDIWTFSSENYRQKKLKYFKEDDSYRDDIYSIITSNEQFLEVEIELGGFFSTPAISREYLVVTSTDGYVYCLKKSGK
jgi:eukaryotic-like serine/threonine-protein kinase